MSLATAVRDALAGDGALAALLTGGVYTRSIKSSGKGATPDAFSESGALLPCAVVKDRGEAADDAGTLGAFAGFPQVWLYAPTTSTGRTALEAAAQRVIAVLSGKTIAGQGVRTVGRLGVDDDPEMAGALVDMIRLQTDGVWGYANG